MGDVTREQALEAALRTLFAEVADKCRLQTKTMDQVVAALAMPPAQGVEFTRGGEAAIEAAANACRRVGWPKAYERHPENYGREALARHLAAEECANAILALLPPAPEASHDR